MKKRTILFLFAISIIHLLNSGRAHSSDDDLVKQVEALRERVLQARIWEILSYRQEALRVCSDRTGNFNIRDLRFRLDTILQSPLHSPSPIKLMEIYGETEDAKHLCDKEIINRDGELWKAERSRFLSMEKLPALFCIGVDIISGLPTQCLSKTIAILKDIDPHCSLLKEKGIYGGTDTSTCYGSDILVASRLRQRNDPGQAEIAAFLNKADEALETIPKPSKVDLWQIFLTDHADTFENRERFLAIMTILTVPVSSWGTHMDGATDYYWKRAYEETRSPEAALAEYHQFKRKIDWSRWILRFSKENSISLMAGNENLNGKNAHDYEASFLACYYRRNSWFTSHVIPRVLGYAYKLSKPVILPKNSSEAAYREAYLKNYNYVKDGVQRYNSGTTWGYQFCTQPDVYKIGH